MAVSLRVAIDLLVNKGYRFLTTWSIARGTHPYRSSDDSLTRQLDGPHSRAREGRPPCGRSPGQGEPSPRAARPESGTGGAQRTQPGGRSKHRGAEAGVS